MVHLVNSNWCKRINFQMQRPPSNSSSSSSIRTRVLMAVMTTSTRQKIVFPHTCRPTTQRVSLITTTPRHSTTINNLFWAKPTREIAPPLCKGWHHFPIFRTYHLLRKRLSLRSINHSCTYTISSSINQIWILFRKIKFWINRFTTTKIMSQPLTTIWIYSPINRKPWTLLVPKAWVWTRNTWECRRIARLPSLTKGTMRPHTSRKEADTRDHSTISRRRLRNFIVTISTHFSRTMKKSREVIQKCLFKNQILNWVQAISTIPHPNNHNTPTWQRPISRPSTQTTNRPNASSPFARSSLNSDWAAKTPPLHPRLNTSSSSMTSSKRSSRRRGTGRTHSHCRWSKTSIRLKRLHWSSSGRARPKKSVRGGERQRGTWYRCRKR